MNHSVQKGVFLGRLKKYNRENVLETAMSIFWEKGFAHTSLCDLEKVTGVNKSGLYSEFADKEDLFLHTLQHFIDTDHSHQFLYEEPLGWKNIEDHLKHGIRKKGKKGSYCVNTVRDLEQLPPKAKRLLNQRGEKIKEILLKNIKNTNTKKDPTMLVNMIVTFYYGINLRTYTEDLKKLEVEVDDFLKFLKA
ncbi:MAG: TetR/AcrR family transcriptional regulator [Leptospira sp.]|nr:TetR/AcrR family transcriptional regulator [Leptospira sp.]